MKILDLLANAREASGESWLECGFYAFIILIILVVGISDPIWWAYITEWWHG